MEKLSRVKKYEDLRKSIEMDNNIDATVQDESLAASENLLKSFDSSVFKKVEIKEEEETPKRAKAFDDQTETNKENLNDTFTNEYLDDFIKRFVIIIFAKAIVKVKIPKLIFYIN